MTEELKPDWSPDERYIRGSLDHTAGPIDGAKALLEKNLPHLAYHLALLALEEIGKMEVVLVGRVADADDEASFRKKFSTITSARSSGLFGARRLAGRSSTNAKSTGTRTSRRSSTRSA